METLVHYIKYIMQNAELDEAQVGIKIARRNINNLRYADDTTLMAESEEELKNLLMKVKEESKNVGLKLNIQKTKIMASGPIISWQIDGETVADLFEGCSKITAMVIAAIKLKDTFSSGPQSFPASGSFQMSQFFTSGVQNIGASASVLPMNIQD